MLKESAWLAADVRRRMAEVAPRAIVVAADRTSPRSARFGWRSPKPRGGARVPPYIDSHRSTPPPPPRLRCAAVIIERFEDDDALSSALATRVLETIVARPALVLGLPTGRTPLGALSRAAGAQRGRSHRLVAGANIQSRRVRRPCSLESEQLSRLHAGRVVRACVDRSGEHRIPERGGARSARGVPSLRRCDRGGRRHRSADPRDWRERSHRVQRAGGRLVRADARRGARTGEQGSQRAKVRRRLDQRSGARLVDGHGDDSQRSRDCLDRNRRREGRRRARNDRRIDNDAACRRRCCRCTRA